MCGVGLAIENVRKHLGQHMLDAALFTLPYPEADKYSNTTIEGAGTSIDKTTPQMWGSLGSSVLEFNSNPDRGSDLEGFHDAYSSEVQVGTEDETRASDHGETYIPEDSEGSPQVADISPVASQPPGKAHMNDNIASGLLTSQGLATIGGSEFGFQSRAEGQNVSGMLPPGGRTAPSPISVIQPLLESDLSDSASAALPGSEKLYPDPPTTEAGENTNTYRVIGVLGGSHWHDQAPIRAPLPSPVASEKILSTGLKGREHRYVFPSRSLNKITVSRGNETNIGNNMPHSVTKVRTSSGATIVVHSGGRLYEVDEELLG